MKLWYLGTSAAEGWPAPFCRCEACNRARHRGGKDIRTRSQALIDDKILIDLPGDTVNHANRFDLDLGAVNHLLITHSHNDHFSPFDLELRMEPYAHFTKPLHVYCNETVYGIFTNALPKYATQYKEHIHFHIIHAFDVFDIEDYHLEALRADHKPGEECLIYRITKGGVSLLYGHDTGYFPDDTWQFLWGKNHDIVSLDCTYCLQSSAANHMGLPENILVRQRMLKQGMADESTKFVINHFTHNCADENGYAELAQTALAQGFFTSYDGFEISCNVTNRKDDLHVRP